MDEYIPAIKSLYGFHEAVKVARLNTEGPVYLVGDKVFRTCAREKYSCLDKFMYDFDFLIERKHLLPRCPPGWSYHIDDKHGLVWKYAAGGTFRINLILRERTALEDYFRSVPLTIQAIALDVGIDIDIDKIWGEIGVRALEEKTIRVNNAEQLARIAERLYPWAKQREKWYIDRINAKLGFNVVL